MTNREIARKFRLMARLMELHGADGFKIRAYRFAADEIRYMEKPMAGKDAKALMEIEGIGKAISEKILSLVDSGSFKALDELVERTPPGVVQIIQIRGFSVGKTRTLWKELGLDNVSALRQALESGVVAQAKGFGKKTEENLLEALNVWEEAQA